MCLAVTGICVASGCVLFVGHNTLLLCCHHVDLIVVCWVDEVSYVVVETDAHQCQGV